jgi:hypothetical protein
MQVCTYQFRKGNVEFWKQQSNTFPFYAGLVKQHLSVKASSAAVERMISISGNIFSQSRKRMTTVFLLLCFFLTQREAIITLFL